MVEKVKIQLSDGVAKIGDTVYFWTQRRDKTRVYVSADVLRVKDMEIRVTNGWRVASGVTIKPTNDHFIPLGELLAAEAY